MGIMGQNIGQKAVKYILDILKEEHLKLKVK